MAAFDSDISRPQFFSIIIDYHTVFFIIYFNRVDGNILKHNVTQVIWLALRST